MSIIRAEITYSDGTVAVFTGTSQDTPIDLTTIPTEPAKTEVITPDEAQTVVTEAPVAEQAPEAAA